MKTGLKIIKECFMQPLSGGEFKTLDEMIDRAFCEGVSELRTGLCAAIEALEYAAAEVPHLKDEIWFHVNRGGGPDIRELVKRTE